jgi:hypothetical protein
MPTLFLLLAWRPSSETLKREPQLTHELTPVDLVSLGLAAAKINHPKIQSREELAPQPIAITNGIWIS